MYPMWKWSVRCVYCIDVLFVNLSRPFLKRAIINYHRMATRREGVIGMLM
jgi:hypothetical protein